MSLNIGGGPGRQSSYTCLAYSKKTFLIRLNITLQGSNSHVHVLKCYTALSFHLLQICFSAVISAPQSPFHAWIETLREQV